MTDDHGVLTVWDHAARVVDLVLGATLVPVETLALRLVNRPFR